jgi:SAM-dependent methyltransferase
VSTTDPKAWEHQRRTFERTADAYDRHRPTYPEALFDDIRRYADLAAGDDRILEIGCGPGIATRHLAEWPNRVTALEPAEAMADLARLNLASHDDVEVITTTFEDWAIERDTFGLVLVAQAYHWLDPDTSLDRIADALYAHGTAAIVANVQVVTPETLPFFERVNDVYREHTPGLEHQGAFRTAEDLPANPLDDSPRFYDQVRIGHPWDWTLSSDDYVALLATHSSHAALGEDVRDRLHDGIASLIESDYGGTVTEHYVALAGLARRAN